jgi:hypothetical protein
MSQSTAARSFVLFFFVLSLFGCVADTRHYEPECRCVVQSGRTVYDLPCGVQACLDGVAVECISPEEAPLIDIECDAGEATFEEGVCEGEPNAPARCEDQRGESGCESTAGCSWLPAACTYTEAGCEAWSEPAPSRESAPSRSSSSSCDGLTGVAYCLCVTNNYGACSSYI